MRFLVYFLAPVPLAVLGLLVGTLVSSRISASEHFEVVGALLVAGYVSMGLQSALFAVGMLWLERRGLAPITRYIVAACAGGTLGATLGLVTLPVALFTLLGASVGPAVVILVDLVAAVPGNRTLRHVGPMLLVATMIPCAGGAVGGIAEHWWVDALRRGVLASVSIGMTYDDVARVAGPPTHDSRKVAFSLPTESVDVVWMYDREDPGPAEALQVVVSFKNERVVEIRRTPVPSRG